MRVMSTPRSSYGRRAFLGQSAVVAASGIGLLSACSSPKPPVVTPVSLQLVGGPDMNPDARGRASPLTVRVYALKSATPFEAAEFFTLFDKDQATLGAELVQREEALMRPGESRKMDFTFSADVKALAFMAAFRDLERARWREVRVIEPGKAQNLTVLFAARTIRISAAA